MTGFFRLSHHSGAQVVCIICVTIFTLSMIRSTSAQLEQIPLVAEGMTIEIAENVYVIPDNRVRLVPNVGIIVGDTGVLVVETGMGPANAATVINEVRKITNKPIRYLVSTHFHPEHNSGASAFPKETLIVLPARQQADLERKGQRFVDLFIELFGDKVQHLLEPVTLIDADVTFERKVTIDLGNLKVELIHLGKSAHTNGDSLIYLPAQKVLFVGGLAPSQIFPIFPDEESSGEGWIQSLTEIERMEFDIIVPGHGPIGDRRLIEAVKGYLMDLKSRVLVLKSDSVPLEEVQEITFAEFKARHPNWNMAFWIKNATASFYR